MYLENLMLDVLREARNPLNKLGGMWHSKDEPAVAC